jgi:hypothetical protein
MTIDEAKRKHPHATVWRYSAANDWYTLSSFTATMADDDRYTPCNRSNEPKWLTEIVLMGRMGGHDLPIANPPPETVLWFATENGDFLTFLEVT